MSTLTQIKANQQNSQKSTGPKTPEGKKRSALNAIRHNLTGQIVVVQESETGIYDTHCKEYRDDFAPKGKVEIDLTQELADLRWSINRIRAHETTLFSFQSVALSSTLESVDPDVNSAREIFASLEKNMKTLALLSVYEQRKLRAFEKTLAKLKEIQSERKDRENIDLRKAAEYREVFQNEEPDWTPAQDGFVCSEAQIDAYTRQWERAKIVYYARNGQLDPRDRTQKRS
jgi:hypothetical protein